MEINASQIIYQLINFGVVFVAITFLVYKPLIKLFDERRKKILEAETVHETTTKEKEELEISKKKAKLQSQREAEKLLDEATEQAKKLKSQLTKETHEEIKQLRDQAQAKWQEELASEKRQREEEMAELVLKVASKVIGKEVDTKTHSALINESISELETTLA